MTQTQQSTHISVCKKAENTSEFIHSQQEFFYKRILDGRSFFTSNTKKVPRQAVLVYNELNERLKACVVAKECLANALALYENKMPQERYMCAIEHVLSFQDKMVCRDLVFARYDIEHTDDLDAARGHLLSCIAEISENNMNVVERVCDFDAFLVDMVTLIDAHYFYYIACRETYYSLPLPKNKD